MIELGSCQTTPHQIVLMWVHTQYSSNTIQTKVGRWVSDYYRHCRDACNVHCKGTSWQLRDNVKVSEFGSRQRFCSIRHGNKFVHYEGNKALGSTAAEETCADAATIGPTPYRAGTRRAAARRDAPSRAPHYLRHTDLTYEHWINGKTFSCRYGRTNNWSSVAEGMLKRPLILYDRLTIGETNSLFY